MDPAPGFMVVGHLTLDTDEGGYLLGGAAYAALSASRLGYRVGLVTSFGPDLDPTPIMEGVTVVCRPAPESTVFQNVYQKGRREQRLLSQALPLETSQVPLSWRRLPILLAPMAGEIGPEFLEAFPGAVMGACPQGWLRSRGVDGRIEPAVWTWATRALQRLNLMVLSVEDVAGDLNLVSNWAKRIPCLALTCGEEGGWLYVDGVRQHVPAFLPARTVDPTGAGDAFASAFMVKWHETGDPVLSARFASLVARFVVEEKGLGGVPTRDRVDDAWHRLAPRVA